MFRIAKHEFQVSRADLVPFVSADEKHVCWGVEFEAEGNADLADWRPELTADRLVTTAFGSVRHWREIAPCSGRWTVPSEKPEASLYVFEHTPLYDCSWELRQTGAQLSLHLEGRADLGDDRRAVNVTIDQPLEIAPWPFGRISERECRTIYVKTGLRDEVEFRDVRGVAHLVFR